MKKQDIERFVKAVGVIPQVVMYKEGQYNCASMATFYETHYLLVESAEYRQEFCKVLLRYENVLRLKCRMEVTSSYSVEDYRKGRKDSEVSVKYDVERSFYPGAVRGLKIVRSRDIPNALKKRVEAMLNKQKIEIAKMEERWFDEQHRYTVEKRLLETGDFYGNR